MDCVVLLAFQLSILPSFPLAGGLGFARRHVIKRDVGTFERLTGKVVGGKKEELEVEEGMRMYK